MDRQERNQETGSKGVPWLSGGEPDSREVTPHTRYAWRKRSRQQEGSNTEKQILKRLGARAHPRSGAGKIKHDGSTEEELIEIKDAGKTFTMNGTYLTSLWRVAIKQDKKPVLIIKYTGLARTVTATVFIEVD